MKYTILSLLLIVIAFGLISCEKAIAPDTSSGMLNIDDVIDSTSDHAGILIPGVEDKTTRPVIQDEYVLITQKGNTIIINNFGANIGISSPFTITGKAPRKWFFEGSFPISIMTPQNDIVKQWYATGDWLVPITENGELGGDDMISFTSTIEFSTPLATNKGKIQLKADNPSGLKENDDMVEISIIFD